MLETLVIGIVLLVTASKGVDLWKHDKTTAADKYAACIEATKDARECRGLE